MTCQHVERARDVRRNLASLGIEEHQGAPMSGDRLEILSALGRRVLCSRQSSLMPKTAENVTRGEMRYVSSSCTARKP